MRIRIIAVGKIKEAYLREGLEDYYGRLKRYHQLEEHEVKGSKRNDDAALKEEAQRLIKCLDSYPETCTVVLTPEGKSFSTEKLAREMENWMSRGVRNLDLIIGGEEGLHEEVKKKANLLLSLSPLTFPHQLSRLILAEQLYRCCKILKGESYHR